ncbi:Outer membrane protein beta-barrel domain-containing protein [Flavobacterium sp. CF108]|uniref:porin family protein n=1 Tax=unclassified Flavobacterium TaxID=196869 RepID=UPI0008B5903F|nr:MULTISPECIES: porin family protein [unclassified Flavobacterium]SEO79403.1 Outer membrane protein beta-barrel domain-containing protein [Flavobacterium sp. fv08]SHG76116.1 Outer membrane protein beta-barrel domain-containing protein [Flavobacterium sp. CF108]
MKMQTNFLCTLTLFISASFGMLHAQDNNVNTEFGVKGGFNMSNLYNSGEDVDDNNILYGFNAGVYATLPVSDFVAIQPEILFTTKGAELEYNNALISGDAKFRLNYIEVPLLVRVNITKNFNVHAGGYASYLVSSKFTGSGDIVFDQEIDTDDLNKFDAGISAGLGVDFNPISIGLRYNYGLTTVGKERTVAGTTYTFPDAKNSNLTLYLSYKLN